MTGIEKVKNGNGKEPAREMARKTQLNCFRKGLFVSQGGFFSNVSRLRHHSRLRDHFLKQHMT